MQNKMQIRHILLLALLTAIYVILYFAALMVSWPFGNLGHALSPGICGLLNGAVLLFISRKVGKMWQYTCMSGLVMGVFSMMGSAYLPWLISVLVASALADFLSSGSKNPPVWRVALSSALIHVGHSLGGMIPAMFFLESFKEEWIRRGQTEQAMDEMVLYYTGYMALIVTLIITLLSVAGVFLGYKILRKHLEKSPA